MTMTSRPDGDAEVSLAMTGASAAGGGAECVPATTCAWDVTGDVRATPAFDDIPLANLVTPRLTTIRQPVERIAARAVGAIIGQTPLPTEAELLQATLIIRTSSAAPRPE